MKYTTNQNHGLRITRQITKQHFNNQRFLKIASPYLRATKQIDRLDRSKPRDREKKKKKKKKKKRQDDDDVDDDEDEDEMYYPSQDYGDDSNVDPEYRPSKEELKGADKEGDK